jgi:hypothetical protein
VTGEDRDDTSRRNVGGQLVWDKVFGSNLALEYSVRKVDIGSKPMRFFVTGAYFAVDSNIDFYNQEAILGMGGVAFRWK